MPFNPGNFESTGPIAYDQRGKNVVLSPNTSGGIGIGEAVVTNRSGGAVDCGWGWRHNNSVWVAGQVDDSATPDYIDDTTDAQSAATGDFAVTTTTNNDGCLIGSKSKFNLIGFTISTASTGSPVYTYTYYDGSTWKTLPLYDSGTPVFSATGDTCIVFPAPNDWAKGTTSAVATTLGDYYCIRILATTAPSQAVVASILWVASLVDVYPNLGDDAQLDTEMSTEIVIPQGSGVMPYFGTVAAGNTIQLHYRKLWT